MEIGTKPKDIATSKAVQDLSNEVTQLKQLYEDAIARIKKLESA